MKAILAILICLSIATLTPAQQVMPLYTDSIPNFILTPDEETTATDGILRISKVSRPTLTAYFPAKQQANGTAVIICPGGGYAILAADHEGEAVARKLTEAGITAFVLKYRLPSDAIMKQKSIGPLQDAQQAIKMVRDSAARWNLNKNRIGIMGFSAGGHLASSAGTHYQPGLIGNATNTSLRPDFMVLIYPVISLQDGLAHVGSRENLLGKNASPEIIKYYSNHLQVTGNTPPTFLVHAGDDNAVSVENSIQFYQALQAHGVPAEMHLYQRGGHGFGMQLPGSKDLWLERCKNWMTANGWLQANSVKVSIEGM